MSRTTETKPDYSHLFSRLSKRQVEALASAAFGQEGAGFTRRTMESLERLGLVERSDAEVRFPDGMTLSFAAWHTPIPVHMAFCYWAAQQPDEEEE